MTLISSIGVDRTKDTRLRAKRGTPSRVAVWIFFFEHVRAAATMLPLVASFPRQINEFTRQVGSLEFDATFAL